MNPFLGSGEIGAFGDPLASPEELEYYVSAFKAGRVWKMSVTEVDDLGFEAPTAVGLPVRANLPKGLQIGPEIGERLPDFALPDQNGAVVDFHADRGSSPAVVVFYRSAVW